MYSRLPPHPTMSTPLPPAGSSLVKVLSNCRSSRVVSPAPLPLLAPVAVLAAEEAGGSASMTVEDARAAEGEAAAAMALALPLPELLLMAAVGAGQVGARRAAAAPQAPVAHGCGAWRAPREAAAVLPRWIRWRTGLAAAAVVRVRPNSSECAPAAMSCSGVASQRKLPSLQVWHWAQWAWEGRGAGQVGGWGGAREACLRRLGRSAAAAGASKSRSSPRTAAARTLREMSDRSRVPRQLGVGPAHRGSRERGAVSDASI